MNHIDLFSGIGGFSLACSWLGIQIQTEVFCEKDERCQSFLRRTYPNISVHDDIRTFDGSKWQDRWLLTAGVPCQPASRAGKQRGKADDRWLWPEAIRVIGEAKPAWVLCENPPGIGDVGLSGILADLEGQGYEVRVLGIPACAVNAPHIRNRYWILAHCNQAGRKGWGELGKSDTKWEASTNGGYDASGSTESVLGHSESSKGRVLHEHGRPGEPDIDIGRADQNSLADSERGMLQRGGERGIVAGKSEQAEGEGDKREWGGDAIGGSVPCNLADTEGPRSRAGLCQSRTEQDRDGITGGLCDMGDPSECKPQSRSPQSDQRYMVLSSPWEDSLWTPCADSKFRRAPGDSFSLVDGLHRSVLAALGNSIVPQVAYQVIKAMIQADTDILATL